MALNNFQKASIRNAVRSTLVDRLHLLGFTGHEVTEGLWTLHKGGAFGCVSDGTRAVNMEIERLVLALEKALGDTNGRAI